MSFSSCVKNELYKIPITLMEDAKLELYGILCFSKSFSSKSICIKTENSDVFKRAITLFDYNNINIKNMRTKISHSLCSIEITDNKDCANIVEFFGLDKDYISNTFIPLNYKNIREHHLCAFFRGVFLICGTVTDPSSDYHLEFSVQNTYLSKALIDVFNNMVSIKISPNSVKRRSSTILYIKGNEQITDFLTFIGATKASMDFIQAKMIKEVRNYVNRTTNFETANISKTAQASLAQIKAIEHIKSLKGLEYLPDTLRETAILRLKNPYMSLEELAASFSEPISRSGVNHRLKKILNISKEI